MSGLKKANESKRKAWTGAIRFKFLYGYECCEKITSWVAIAAWEA